MSGATLTHLTLQNVRDIAAACRAARNEELIEDGAKGGVWSAADALEPIPPRGSSPADGRYWRMIKALSNEACIELVALMYIGRGDSRNFGNAVTYALKMSDKGDRSYIYAKPLHHYLPAAIERLRLDGQSRLTEH